MNSVSIWSFIAAFVISAGIWFLFTSAIDIIEDIIVNKKKEKKECSEDVTSTSSKMDEL